MGRCRLFDSQEACGNVEFRPPVTVSPRVDTSSSRSTLPHLFSSKEELGKFYDDLYTAMQSNKAYFNIIMGDFKNEENCLISAFDYGD